MPTMVSGGLSDGFGFTVATPAAAGVFTEYAKKTI